MARKPRAASRRVTKTVTGADTWSGPIQVRIGALYGRVSGSFAGHVSVQRSHDNGTTWTFVCVLPAGAAPVHIENVVLNAWYRIGFGATGYVSGAADVELAQ